jgi:outer membrane protein TolC
MIRLLFFLSFLIFTVNAEAQEAWTLQDLINYASKNSLSLIQSRMDVEIATLDEDIAQQDHIYGFTLDAKPFAGFAFGRRVVNGGVLVSGTSGTSFVPFVSLNFDYPLLSQGRFIFQRSISQEIAGVLYKQSYQSYQMQKQQVIYSVSDLFLQIVFKEKELRYLNQIAARLKTVVEQSRERLRNKLIIQADFLEVELKLTDEQTNITLSNMDLNILKKQLANIIGMPLEQELPGVEEDVSLFENMNSIIPDSATLQSQALEQNPKLSIASLDIEKSQLESKLVENSIYPTTSLTATSVFSLNSFDDGHLIGMTVSFPIRELFIRFLTKDPEALKAKLAIEKSRINLESVHNFVELQVIQDYTDWNKARELAMSAWSKVKAKEARVNEEENRMNNKLITIGEYLEYINSYENAYNEFELDKSKEYNALLTLLKDAGIIDRFLGQSKSSEIVGEESTPGKSYVPVEYVEKKSELEMTGTNQEKITFLTPVGEPTKLENKEEETTRKNVTYTLPSFESKGKYAVQIAAYKKEEEAKKIAENLKSKGYPTSIKTTQNPGKGCWYRVKIGPFKTKEEAQIYKDRLETNGLHIKTAFITVSN